MKEAELRQHAICSLCNMPIGHTGIPMFWTITLTRHAVDLRAVRRQDGLTAMLGGHALLAQHMGRNEEMTKALTGPITITACEDCAFKQIAIQSAMENKIEMATHRRETTE